MCISSLLWHANTADPATMAHCPCMDCKKYSLPDVFEQARLVHVRWPATKQPNSGRGKRMAKAAQVWLLVDVWMDQPLYDTGKAASALTLNKAIIDRCTVINGRSFKCQDCLYDISKFGDTCWYTVAELLSNIKHSYVMLQAEVLYSVCHVSTTDKCARCAGNSDMSCLFESAVLQQSRSLFEEVYQIFLGDDLVNEKDADSRPDCAEWRLAKWAELNVLIGMGCWHYQPKSNKHNDPVEKTK